MGIEQRLILITAGETDSTGQNKFHSSKTDENLNSKGQHRMQMIAKYMVGPGKFIDPKNVAKIYCSNLESAEQSMKIITKKFPQLPEPEYEKNIDEVDFGDYEGMTIEQIRSKRAENRTTGDDGILRFEILKMGCDGGEINGDIEERCKDFMGQADADLREGLTQGINYDIIVFGHKKIFEGLARHWRDPESGTRFQNRDFHFVIGDGEVAIFTLDYENKFIPAIKLGGGFWVPDQ